MSIRILVLVLLGTVQLTHAQTYPVKPVRIIVPFAPGGGGDFVARLLGQKMGESWGQQVIIENRGGASGNIGAEAVAKAAPDGYTILLAASSFVVNPNIYKSVPYDAVNDFTAITQTTVLPNFLVVHPSLPVKSVQELIVLAKARPGELNYASGSAGSSPHLAAELFKYMAGVNIVRIPYRGNALGYTDVIRGQVQLIFPTASSVAPHLQSRRLRPLAVTTAQPSVLFPDLPTVAASGVPGYEMATITGMFAPAATPAALIRRLNQEVVRVLLRPDIKERFLNVGVETVGSSPEEFAATIKSEMGRLGKVIRDAGIRDE